MGDSMYCFLSEASKEGSCWEFGYCLYGGKGYRKALVFPKKSEETKLEKSKKMFEMALFYLNNPDSSYVVGKSLEERLHTECDPPRRLPSVLRVHWIDSNRGMGTMVEKFAKRNEEGVWVEIEKPIGFLEFWQDQDLKKEKGGHSNWNVNTKDHLDKERPNERVDEQLLQKEIKKSHEVEVTQNVPEMQTESDDCLPITEKHDPNQITLPV